MTMRGVAAMVLAGVLGFGVPTVMAMEPAASTVQQPAGKAKKTGKKADKKAEKKAAKKAEKKAEKKAAKKKIAKHKGHHRKNGVKATQPAPGA